VADDLPIDLPPRLIVGLGNPGKSYTETRHNVGFMVLDTLATRMALTWKAEKAWHCEAARSGETWFLKPTTFMNDSGRAVAAVLRFLKLLPAQVLVVYDDVDLPLGTTRIRLAGSAAGHNGIKSLISHLGTDAFGRIKIGVAGQTGRPDGDRLAEYVLGKFSEDEKAHLAQVVDSTADALQAVLRNGMSQAMNLFNRKSA
jgi:peptidyl-tRNA hydrolase, PTH1 family